MKNIFKLFFAGLLGSVVLGMASPALVASPTLSAEDESIQDLVPTKSEGTITSAMSQLERMYHQDFSNTNAIPALKKLLTDERSLVRRKAARLLGVFHAQLTDDEIKEICMQLRSTWSEECSALKALRDLDAKQAVPDVLPLLRDSNSDVVRDACRTLAVIANKSVIPSIEPLLHSPNARVVEDARKAIDQLKLKS
ncbi:MAG TPA: HEAT repeat domain-containing protein [Verrucomicrobiae bacterium]